MLPPPLLATIGPVRAAAGCGALDPFDFVGGERLGFDFHKKRLPVTLSQGSVAWFGSPGTVALWQQQP